ncbi:MAG: ankyrin repeat domain-containing protein [Pseudomonadota bacterium]|nr:ankyrin repeat domain-containing protein [Pseudomonadota bacterium]
MKFDLKEWTGEDDVISEELRDQIVAAIDADSIESFPDVININSQMTNTHDKYITETTTVLTYAAQMGSKEMVQHLILLGANVNASNLDGHGPLDAALSHNRLEIVDVLLTNGADTTYLCQGGKTVRSYLCRFANHTSLECIERLLKHITDNGLLESHDMVEVAKAAISTAANFALILRHIDGNVALNDLLQLAVDRDSDQVCTLLLKKIDAIHDKFKFDKEYYPLIFYTISRGSHKALAALYLSGRFSFNEIIKFTLVHSEVNRSPLIWAIDKGKTQCALYLCSLPNIDVNLSILDSFRSHNPLYYAVSKQQAVFF